MTKKITIEAWFSNMRFFLKIPIKIAQRPFYYGVFFINDLLSFFGFSWGESKILFIAGFPKSGTTWVENFFARIPGYNPRQLGGDSKVIQQHDLPDDAFKWSPKLGYSSIKTHINPNKPNLAILRKANVKKILVMYRDPRDIVVSNYYHVLQHNPVESDRFQSNYKNIPKVSGLAHSLEWVIEIFPPWINGWFDLAENTKDIDFYFLSYEDLRSNEEDVFASLIQFFGVSLTMVEVKNILNKISKHPKNFNPVRGHTAYKSTFRRGLVGSWELEFDDNLKVVANKKLNQILKQLGYVE